MVLRDALHCSSGLIHSGLPKKHVANLQLQIAEALAAAEACQIQRQYLQRYNQHLWQLAVLMQHPLYCCPEKMLLEQTFVLLACTTCA